MENRGTWAIAGLGLALIALLMLWMGKTLDTKAPIRIDRGGTNAAGAVRTSTPEEEAERELADMRALVTRRAPGLASRAAEQAFSGEEAARARCAFTEARLVHRDGTTAYWNVGFSCVDPRQPGAFPNLTTVSVRLGRDGSRWVVEN